MFYFNFLIIYHISIESHAQFMPGNPAQVSICALHYYVEQSRHLSSLIGIHCYLHFVRRHIALSVQHEAHCGGNLLISNVFSM